MFPLLLIACQSAPVPPASALLLSMEAVPGNGFAIHGRTYNTQAATVAQRQAFTAQIVAEVVPDVLGALAIPPGQVVPTLSVGGYQLQTSPSIVLQGALDPAGAQELAAALGWTTFQWSVLVARLGEADGGTAVGAVHFPHPPDSAEAQAFFVHAAAIDPGLGGGYLRVGEDLLFFNLRGADGAPYSKLEDDAFLGRLGEAARRFSGAPLTLLGPQRATALLVEGNWSEGSAPGASYLQQIDDAAEVGLAPVQAEYLAALESSPSTATWAVAP